MKGFVFTLDSFFALIVAGMGISMLMYLQYTSTGIYQSSVQEAYNLLQSTLHENIVGICNNVSLGGINGCVQVNGTGAYRFGTYTVQPYQSLLQVLANMYLNTNSVQAAGFNGVNSYIDVGSASSLNLINSFTISAWVNPKQAPSGYGYAQVVAETTSGGVGTEFGWGNGVSCSGIYTTNGPTTLTSTNSICNNVWSHIVLTYSGSAATLYINGVNAGGAGSITFLSSSQDAGIGRAPARALLPFNGLISDVQIYNTALTANQVKSLYSEGTGGIPLSSGLVGWWPLNGNANDYSGNGNTGIPTNVVINNMGYSSPGPFASTLLSAAYPSINTTLFINNLYAPSINLQSASFNGGISSDVATSSALTKPSSGTFSAWVFPANAFISGAFPIVASFYTDAGIIIQGSSGKPYMQLCNGCAVSIASGALSQNTWTFVVGTWSYNGVSTTAQVYLNGMASGSSAVIAGNGGSSNAVYLGGITGASWSAFNGLLSNVQLYNAALNTTQISQLYKEGITGIPISTSNIVGWWPLDGNANDYSNNGNTGIAVNVIYNNTLSNKYLPASLSGSSQVSKASVPLILNVSGISNVYNVSVVVWR